MNEDLAAPFYDELAEVYHLVYADWDRSIAAQGVALAGIIRERWQPADRVLDAACGIGTQALGLAAAGFEVVGSDISTIALARARREAAARGLTSTSCRPTYVPSERCIGSKACSAGRASATSSGCSIVSFSQSW